MNKKRLLSLCIVFYMSLLSGMSDVTILFSDAVSHAQFNEKLSVLAYVPENTESSRASLYSCKFKKYMGTTFTGKDILSLCPHASKPSVAMVLNDDSVRIIKNNSDFLLVSDYTKKRYQSVVFNNDACFGFSKDSSLYLLEVGGKEKQVYTISYNDACELAKINAIASSEKNHKLALNWIDRHCNCSVEILDVQDPLMPKMIYKHKIPAPIAKACFSPSGTFIALVFSNQVFLIDTEKPHDEARLLLQYDKEVMDICFGETDTHLFVGFQDGTVVLSTVGWNSFLHHVDKYVVKKDQPIESLVCNPGKHMLGITTRHYAALYHYTKKHGNG